MYKNKEKMFLKFTHIFLTNINSNLMIINVKSLDNPLI